MKKLLFWVIILIGIISCKSPSSRSHKMQKITEKVVILNKNGGSIADYEGVCYSYKVKRLSKGIVDYVTIKHLYEQGDTILVTTVEFN